MKTVLCINESDQPNQVSGYALFDDERNLLAIIIAEENEDVSSKIAEAVKENYTAFKTVITKFECQNDFLSEVSLMVYEGEDDEDDDDFRDLTLERVAIYN